MNIRKLWAVGLGLAVVAGLTACDPDELTKQNDNPNDPTEAPPGPLFTNAVRVAAARWGGTFDSRAISLVSQHLAEVQYPESDQYIRIQGGFTTGNFDGVYSSELEDFEQVRRAGLTLDEPGYWAPAQIGQAWVFGMTTDAWGDVPFTDALKGDVEGGTISPSYTPQEEIYDSLFVRLEDAVNALENAPATALSLGSADPVYGGDFAQWQMLGNSLHARHALRIVNVDAAQADAELTAAFNAPGGLIEDNADNAVLAWPGDGLYDNPWAVNFKTRDDHRISTSLMDILQATNDPRLPVYAQPAQSDGQYHGLQNALTHAQASSQLTTTSRPGLFLYPPVTSYGSFPGATGLAQPTYIMTAAEVLFIKAEAAVRGLGGLAAGEAAGYFEDALEASLEQFGVTGGGAFVAAQVAAFNGASQSQKLVMIAQQKWVALYTQGFQAWAEWRRTCVPTSIVPGPAAIEDQVPRRLQYSQTEHSVNASNVSAALSNMGGSDDLFSVRMWWDSNPSAAPTYPGASCGTR
jgi:hypothetical protein